MARANAHKAAARHLAAPRTVGSSSFYSRAALDAEARASVPEGRFIGWELKLSKEGRCSLIVYFVRYHNPLRPLHVQAVEQTSVAI